MNPEDALVTCNNCMFFNNEMPDGTGECRHHPPVIVEARTQFPIVKGGDWFCGQWRSFETDQTLNERRQRNAWIRTR